VDVEVFDGAEVVLVRRLVERDAAVGEDELDSLDERLTRVVVERHRHAQQVRDAPLHHITRPPTPTAVTMGTGLSKAGVSSTKVWFLPRDAAMLARSWES